MSDELIAWISQKSKDRRLSYRELAKQAGVSHTLISKILSGKMKASADFCIRIANALRESPEKVLRLAGILPPVSEDDTLQELIELARSLSQDDREEVLKYVRFRYQERKG